MDEMFKMSGRATGIYCALIRKVEKRGDDIKKVLRF